MQYNQPTSGQHVRIGNWFEELQLQADTGSRYFPPLKDQKSTLKTKDRCITHSEQVKPKDYKTTIQDTLVAPQSRPEYQWSLQKRGPRSVLRDQALSESVDKEFAEKAYRETIISNQMDLETESRLKYVREGFQNDSILRNGSSRPLKNYLSDDKPITIYSDSLSKGGKFTFPTTFMPNTTQPFARSSAFSSSLGETYEKPRPYPTSDDFKAISNFRRRLIRRVQEYVENIGQSTRRIVDSILKSCYTLETIPFDQFPSLFSKFGFKPTTDELRSIKLCFSDDEESGIIIQRLVAFIRGKLYGRRLELVNMIASKLSLDDQVNYRTIELQYQRDCKSFIEDLKEIRQMAGLFDQADDMISIDEIIDYYTDVSAEVENDNDFENFLVNSWSLTKF